MRRRRTRDRVAEVGRDQAEHQVERDPDAEALADQVGQTLAGHDAEPRGHLLHQNERERDRHQRPEQRVAEARRRASRSWMPRVVVDVGGVIPGPTTDRKISSPSSEPAARARSRRRPRSRRRAALTG
jgi:hypothetical protein